MVFRQFIARRLARRRSSSDIPARYQALVTHLDTGFCVIKLAYDADGKPTNYQFIEVNPAFEQQTGIKDATGRWIREIAPQHEQSWFDHYAEVARTGKSMRFEHVATALGRHYEVCAFPDPLGADHVAILFEDVTRRRQVELDLQAFDGLMEQHVAGRVALEDARTVLHQSQKMHVLGQLTGGLAADFNNVLQAIGGSLELALIRIEQGHNEVAGQHLGKALETVNRAAKLTKQLLAFARRQKLEPQRIEPSGLIMRMAEIIRSTIGRQIAVKVQSENAWPIVCDRSQLETALLNLAINARDAMAVGGWLTLKTSNVGLTAADVAGHGVEPGDYVEIAVTDSGRGMDETIKARAFEPFFTTKPGQGGGLGLSQVYGFVRQSGGFVLLDSRPNSGTVVRLYLPRSPEV